MTFALLIDPQQYDATDWEDVRPVSQTNQKLVVTPHGHQWYSPRIEPMEIGTTDSENLKGRPTCMLLTLIFQFYHISC